MSTQVWFWGHPSYPSGRRKGPDVRVRCVRAAEPREWRYENGDLVKGPFVLTRPCTEGEEYRKPKKGSLVDLTYRGETVIGKVVRVRKDGMVTVDVRETVKPHSDEDVAWLDMHPADIHVRK